MRLNKAHRRWAFVALAILLIASAVVFFGTSPSKDAVEAHGSAVEAESADVIFASPGRVEGASDATDVGAAADGILRNVYVEEGQPVKRGALLAEIACQDLEARLQTASAEADAARQARTRLLRGARDEEKKMAADKTDAARATFQEAKSRLDMQRALFEKEEISRAVYDQAVRDLSVAEANLRAAMQNQALVAAPPLQEDSARADAEVSAAEGRVRAAREQIGKCSILAPIDGIVLRVYARRGESYSTVMPRPLFSIADTSVRRIKAEIDERDVERVSLGQKVSIQADALRGKRLRGSVIRISDVMGRKSIDSGDPADRRDRDVLEAVIDLDHGAPSLPIGLRVTVQFLAGKSSAK